MKSLFLAQLVIIFQLLAVNPLFASEKTITLASGSWPPYMSSELPEYGVLSELVSRAFEEEGYRVEYGFYPWSRSMAMTRAGVSTGSLGWLKNDSREKDFFYSLPIWRTQDIIISRKDHQVHWNTVSDLKDYRIGASMGYYYGDEFQAMEKMGELDVERVMVESQNFKKLLVDRIDLMIAEKYVAQYWLEKTLLDSQIDKIKVGEIPLRDDSLYLIISRREADGAAIVESFNKGLIKLKQSGEYEKIVSKLINLNCEFC